MTKQQLNLVQWIVVLPRMGRIYVLCVAGHKTKTAKTLSCGFLFYHGLDGFEPIEPLDLLNLYLGHKTKIIKTPCGRCKMSLTSH